jgi:hypothetical protein
MIAGGLVALGSFLPWATVRTALGSVAITGLENGGDGLVTLILGIGIFVVGAAEFFEFSPAYGLLSFWPPLVAGIIAVAISFIDGMNIVDKLREVNNEFVYGSTGEGVWVVGVGGVMSIMASLAIRKSASLPKAVGWWKVEFSDFSWAAVGASLHLELGSEAAYVQLRTRERPVAALPYADTIASAEGRQRLVVTGRDGRRLVLARSHEATDPRIIAGNWS